MHLFALGVNHESSSLDVCEAFALDADAQAHLYARLSLSADAELVLLSTCNRTEAYGYGTPADARAVRRALARHAGRPWPEAAGFHHTDEAAVRHVLQVAAGMRSMVPGDAQILAQMKDAYRRASDAGTVDMALHRLMHTAFRASKRVACETDLASGAASVSTAAVAMARDYFAARAKTARGRTDRTARGETDGDGSFGDEPLRGRTVLLVGAGQMGRLALSALRSHAPAALRVTNRSPALAAELAEAFAAEPVAWADRHAAAAAADLVLVATGAEAPVLRAEALPERARAAAAALVIDIAMPRNVDPAIGACAGYVVRDLSALKAWTERVEAARRAELPTAEQICEELLADYVTWVFHQEALQPAIQAIRSTFDAIRRQEIDRHAHRFSDLDEAELDRLTGSILQKILAVPIVRLKSVDPDSISYVRGIRLLSTLFSRPDCEEDEEAEHVHGARAADDARADGAGAACPFDPHVPFSERDAERIREALHVE